MPYFEPVDLEPSFESHIYRIPNMKRFVPVVALAFASLCLATSAAVAQVPEALGKESTQFDFWLGDWDIEMSGIPDMSIKRKGRDSVKTLLEGRLIEESMSRNHDGVNFQRGYLTYLGRDKVWQHIVYDTKWGEYRFTGKKVGSNFVLETPDDFIRPMKHRETFSNIKENSFTYTWESSSNKGKTWTEVWHLEYKRASKSETK